jgi:hypothetical protein
MTERQLTLPFMAGSRVYRVVVIKDDCHLLEGKLVDVDGAAVVKSNNVVFATTDGWFADADSAFRYTLDKVQADTNHLVQRLMDARQKAQAG